MLVMIPCTLVGFVIGHAFGETKAAANVKVIQQQKRDVTDSLKTYQEFAYRAIELLDQLGINDDSIDPYYDGPDSTKAAQSRAYRRYCDAYGKLEFLK